MGSRLTVLACVGLSAATLAATSPSSTIGTAQQGQGATFRSGTKLVPVYATVTDAQDRLIPDLTREDFEIYDNDKLQELVVFENLVQPFTAVLMLDTSGSMTDSLKLVYAGAEEFLTRMSPQDKAQVGAFNDKIEFNGVFTSDRDELAAALKELDFGYPTRLNDAIDQSISKLVGIEGRRVIVLLTDGEDTASKTGQGEVLDRARADEVMIYGIGLESDYFNGIQRVRTSPDKVLRRIAEETGGGYYKLSGTRDLGATFARIAQELRSQYVLGFAPAVLDGKVHKLVVKAKRPGTKTRARKTYIAAGDANARPPR
jgi:Ca-activated chloride channel family protein